MPHGTAADQNRTNGRGSRRRVRPTDDTTWTSSAGCPPSMRPAYDSDTHAGSSDRRPKTAPSTRYVQIAAASRTQSKRVESAKYIDVSQSQRASPAEPRLLRKRRKKSPANGSHSNRVRATRIQLH